MSVEVPGIRAEAWDLDDVLLLTDEHFRRVMDLALEQLCIYAHLNESQSEIIVKRFYQLNLEAFKVQGVDRGRWRWILEQLVAEFPVWLAPELVAQVAPTFNLIYLTAPSLIPGAAAMLETLSQVLTPRGIITHADREATAVKVLAHGLDYYFRPIEAVNPKGRKDAGTWKAFIEEQLGVTTEQAAVVEDNIHNILQVITAGVPPWQIVWYRGNHCPDFGQNGEVPEGVKVAQDIRQIPGLLQTLRS